jgi:5-methylcytosine-specific restriction endonuclease McrA
MRLRLSPTDSRVLADLIRDAISGETRLPRQWLLESLLKRVEAPAPGRLEKMDMGKMSDLHYSRGSKLVNHIKKRELGKCESCGFSESAILEIDHIDANRANNDLSNLMLLCPNCHRLKAEKQRQIASEILGIPVSGVRAW